MHYRYDSSFYGLLTVLARIFAWEETPKSITPGAPPQEDLFVEPTLVETDASRADVFLAAVEKKLGFQAARHLLLAHAAEQPGSEMALYRYLAFGRKLGRSPDSHLTQPDVLAIHRLVRLVSHETHRFQGFVRFRRLADGLWYAPIEPEHAILPFLARHFLDRMGEERWLIHDCRRGLGLFGQGRHWQLEKIEARQPLVHAEEEKQYQQLWRTFFAEIAIPERRNPKLQKQFLPMKYWRYLVEMGEA